MTQFDVVVSGLGPVGLTLGTLLGKRGLKVLLLEQEPSFYGLARAVYTDDECMRIFQEGGVADVLAQDMNQESAVQWVRAGKRPIAQFAVNHRPYGWPISNFFYQPFLENKLEDLLKQRSNISVRRGRSITSFEQNSNEVLVTHVASRGTDYGRREAQLDHTKSETTSAKYLIAADGGRSLIRSLLGIKMDGHRFPERWLVVDLEAMSGIDAFRHLPYFNFHCDPELPTVSCPQPGGHHRFEFMVREGQTTSEMEDPDKVRELISQFVDPDEVKVLRKLVYTFNAATAMKWRDGRVLLAGDAAHMTPQFIGQGMSSGVRDAQNLAWKLDAVIRWGADDSILDSYESERKPHAISMIKFSVYMKDFVSLSTTAKANTRDFIIRTALLIPGLAGWVKKAGMKPKPRFEDNSYLGLSRKSSKYSGVLAPQPKVRLYDGKIQLLDETIGDGFCLIGIGGDPRELMSPDEIDIWRGVKTTFVTVYAPGSRPHGNPGDGRSHFDEFVDIEDTNNVLIPWLKRAGTQGTRNLMALRPDKYVFGVADTNTLTKALVAQGLVALTNVPLEKART